MDRSPGTRPGWREAGLILLVAAPLFGLMLIHGEPIRQDPGYHVFADTRTCLGLPNFGNVATNIAFLLAGVMGLAWCRRHRELETVRSWQVFFLGVALVFAGSGYYHSAPGNDALVWDRLPMTIAFMGLFSALLAEHLGARHERRLLVPALVVGIASVFLWKLTDDLRVYVWVPFTPLLAIPYVIAVYPGRYTHRHYLLYGVGCYALAKVAEYYDQGIYVLASTAISGHSVKHLVAAAATLCVYLMLKRRTWLQHQK